MRTKSDLIRFSTTGPLHFEQRAHAVFDPNLTAIPANGTQYHFYTKVVADLPGIGTGIVAESYQDVVALPATAPLLAPFCADGAVVIQK